MRNRNPIKDEVTRRGIECLMHFTQACNLPSIVQHGLLPRAILRDLVDVDARITRENRLDGQDDAISVSIAAINAEMFWAKNRDCGHPYWVVLLLDPCILWTHSCRFFRRNAAKKRVRHHSGRGSWSFGRMFSDHYPPPEFEGESYRTETGFPDYLSTYPDAEVQVFDRILPEYIAGVWVNAADPQELVEYVREQMDKLSGSQRPHYVRPFVEISNGYDSWLVPGEG
ncbi:DUF4433 domain-containing protein [Azospirillum brasilense]|nr:DUF4433 domain-containing protein [Azospirillum brasilense]